MANLPLIAHLAQQITFAQVVLTQYCVQLVLQEHMTPRTQNQRAWFANQLVMELILAFHQMSALVVMVNIVGQWPLNASIAQMVHSALAVQ